jgi:hypothetical protein
VELAVDVVDMPIEVLPTTELKITVDDVPGDEFPDIELVVEPKLEVAVGPVEAVATFELEISEPVLVVEVNVEAGDEAPVLEFETANVEVVVGIEVDVIEVELVDITLELDPGPDERIELHSILLEFEVEKVEAVARIDEIEVNDMATELEDVILELDAGPDG